jgi:tetratricopeptide (TPR) repeat protein
MAEKKKTPAPKTDEKLDERRMVPIPAAKSAKPSDQAESGGADDNVWTAQKQLAAFEAASKLFHARSFAEAKVLFEQAARGPERDVAHRAQLHAEMCARRLERPRPGSGIGRGFLQLRRGAVQYRQDRRSPREPEQSSRHGAQRRPHPLRIGTGAGLSGDLDRAYENLKRAIEIEPRNRLIARQDADLAPLAGQPPLEACSILKERAGNWRQAFSAQRSADLSRRDR